MLKEKKSLEKETYIAPTIEVVEIEIEQNILARGTGDLPNENNDWDMGGEDW